MQGGFFFFAFYLYNFSTYQTMDVDYVNLNAEGIVYHMKNSSNYRIPRINDFKTTSSSLELMTSKLLVCLLN